MPNAPSTSVTILFKRPQSVIFEEEDIVDMFNESEALELIEFDPIVEQKGHGVHLLPL